MATGWFGGDLDTTVKTPVTGWWAEVSRNLQPVGRTITLVGGTPDVRIAKSAIPSGGTITLTGGQPTVTVTQNKLVTPVGGLITLIGSHPALDTTIRPAGRTLTLTGGLPQIGLSDHKVFQPVGGTIALTGSSPTVATTAHVFPTPSGGPIILTGSTPVVTASDHKRVTPTGGVISLTGGQPIARVGYIFQPSPGTITLTGSQPTLLQPILITPVGGLITLVGSRPVMGETVRPVGGAISLTGGQPVVRISDNKVFAPTTGPITLTGGVPVVTATNHQRVTPSAATISLTGSAPVVSTTAHQFIMPTGATITLTGGVPIAGSSNAQAMYPAGGTITLSGGVPVIAISDNKVFQPVGGTIALTGGTPVIGVSNNQRVTPSDGGLILAGGTPVVTATDHKVVQPAGATLTLTGGQPTVAVSNYQRVVPTGGTISLTGGTPTVSIVSGMGPSTDTFNRANGLVGSDWDDASGAPGSTPSSYSIVSNYLQAATPGSGGTRYLKPSGGVNVGISVTLKGPFGVVGTGIQDLIFMYLRANDIDNNGVVCYVYPLGDGTTQVSILDSTFTAVDGAIVTLADGDILSFEIYGSTTTFSINGTPLIVNSTATQYAGLGNETTGITATRGASSTFLGIDNYTTYTALLPPVRVQPTGGTITLTGGQPTVTVTTNPSPPWMIGQTSTASDGTGGTMPTHAVDDLLIAYAYTVGAFAGPIVSGWACHALSLENSAFASVMIYTRRATSASTTHPVITGASKVHVESWRDAAALLAGYYPLSQSSTASSTITYPARPMMKLNGTSIAIRAATATSATNLLTNVPTGHTQIGGHAAVGPVVHKLTTNPTANTTTATQSISPSSVWPALTAELLSTKSGGATIMGCETSSGTTVVIPPHAIGDLILITAARASTTQSSKPAASGTVPAWVDIDAATGANTRSLRSAYFVATATNHTSGTWTNSTAMTATVIRGQHSTPIGGHAVTNGASAANCTAPTITLAQTDGTSIVLAIGSTISTNQTNPPATTYSRVRDIFDGGSWGGGNATVQARCPTTSIGTCVIPLNGNSTFSATQIEIRQH